MTRLRRLVAWLRTLRHASSAQHEMHEEFMSHLAFRADDLVRQGWTREAAERQARVDFGGVEAAKEAGRDARGLHVYDEVRANLRFAVRGIRRRPLLAAIVVLTLAVGIGISTGVLTILDALAFSARVEADPRSFVRLYTSYATDSTPPSFPASTALEDYLAFRAGAPAALLLAGSQGAVGSIDGLSGIVAGSLVTCDFFDVYRLARPLAGRPLQSGDCAQRANVVVISEQVWHDRYDASPRVLGRAMLLDGKPLQIVGVAPNDFSWQTFGSQFWVPFTSAPYLNLGSLDPAAPNAVRLIIDGRLRPGFSRAELASELTDLALRTDALHHGRRTRVFTTDGSIIQKPGNARAAGPIIALVLVAVACLALVACANVMSLLLALAHARRAETAVRIALGSGASRLAAMLLTETTLLAATAGIAAGFVALQTPRLLIPWLSQRALTLPVRPDWLVFGFLAGITLLVGLVAGSGPVRASLELDVVRALKGMDDAGSARTRNGRLLVGSQIAAALALLLGGVTLLRLPSRVASAPVHFDSRRVLALNLVPADRSAEEGGWRQYHARIVQTLSAIPAVQVVAYASALPLDDERITHFVVQDGGRPGRELPTMQISPEYFRALGLSLVRGREFTTADEGCADRGATCPVIVSREVARELWPTGDPIGRSIDTGHGHSFRVVGIAADAPSDVASREDALMVYRPWSPGAQRYHAFVRFSGSADVASRAIVQAIHDAMPDVPLLPATIQSFIDQMAATFERLGIVVAGVAATAAILALIGVYGVVALAVKRRTREMGIRIAVGASRLDVYRAILESSLRPVVWGLAVGAGVASVIVAIANRMAGAVLPARILDLPAFGLTIVLLGVSVLAAILAPARRAASVDPVSVLRQE